MHYLLTGHTGFKGTWLSLLLSSAGHEVSGISLNPVEGSLFSRVRPRDLLNADVRLDIRDAAAVHEQIARIAPDVVIHLAAQPLVRESYRDPRGTFDTNVWGTINVLEATRRTESVQATLIVTTDKVYRNDGRSTGYVESDPLGGHDPYSASKAMADLATQSWRASYPGTPIAIARAGNVIGGGDVSPDRLMPDLIAAFATGTPARIRNPRAIRPWQHVLDCL
jgi:CDP-glucose 4,6-dehydratase